MKSKYSEYDYYDKWLDKVTPKKRLYPDTLDMKEVEKYMENYFGYDDTFYNKNYKYESDYPYQM